VPVNLLAKARPAALARLSGGLFVPLVRFAAGAIVAPIVGD
jgi:hypothetical protein